MKCLFVNAFEVSSTKETFLLIFRFESPDGYKDAVYITLSPSGAAMLHELLSKDIEAYVKKHGDISTGSWQRRKAENNCHENNQQYLS